MPLDGRALLLQRDLFRELPPVLVVRHDLDPPTVSARGRGWRVGPLPIPPGLESRPTALRAWVEAQPRPTANDHGAPPGPPPLR